MYNYTFFFSIKESHFKLKVPCLSSKHKQMINIFDRIWKELKKLIFFSKRFNFVIYYGSDQSWVLTQEKLPFYEGSGHPDISIIPFHERSKKWKERREKIKKREELKEEKIYAGSSQIGVALWP